MRAAMLFERFKGDIAFVLLRVWGTSTRSQREGLAKMGFAGVLLLVEAAPSKGESRLEGGGFHGGGGVWVRRPGRVSQTRQTRTPAAIARERDRRGSARDRPWPLRGRGAPGAPTRASEASGSAV